MKYLSIFLIIILLPLTGNAVTLSGESTISSPRPATIQQITYYMGKNGGCYMLTKSKKTGKTYKKYVDKQFCKKKGKK